MKFHAPRKPSLHDWLGIAALLCIACALLSLFILGARSNSPERDLTLTSLSPLAALSHTDFPASIPITLRRSPTSDQVRITVGQIPLRDNDFAAISAKLAEVNTPGINIVIIPDADLTVDQVARAVNAALTSPMKNVSLGFLPDAIIYATGPHVPTRADDPASATIVTAAPIPTPETPALDKSFAGLILPPAPVPPSTAPDPLMAAVDSLSSGSGGAASNSAADAALEGVSPGFRGLVGTLRGKGLDVVFVLDATESMGPYIDQARKRLQQVVTVVSGLVPKVRFGAVAFKDYGDDYGPHACKSIKLAEDPQQVRKFLDTIVAGGGGDQPEPIHEALAIATDRNAMNWQPGRKCVIILVTDAPCHATARRAAVDLAERFASRSGLDAVVNVIDVGGSGNTTDLHRRDTILTDLSDIAKAGKGSAFLLQDDKAFWQHLIVSVFGERYRNDVETIIEKFVTEKP